MSLRVSDVLSDCEELVDETFRFSDDFLDKKTNRKRSAKPPQSPKSPYLNSLNVNPRRAAVAAWRLPRASLGGSREGTPGDRDTGPERSAYLTNGHDVSLMIPAQCNLSPELIRKNWRKQQRLLHTTSNGLTAADFRDKEDLYNEIIRLKKSLHAQKSDSRQMRAKVRRLEEENARREKQIEELLEPKTGPDFVRSLVDKKREGSVVVNGLKQRILKLEQQCREKESALSKLQSDLRTTNMEELKITAQTYFEEVQRLKILLDAAEKSCRAESKCSQRQQRALNSTVRHLTERVSQLQQENRDLREQLDTEYPAAGLTGYREWSKQRLLRRLLELEKRLENKKEPAQLQHRAALLDRGVQTTANHEPFAMATEAGITVATMTEDRNEREQEEEEEERERKELQERVRRTEEELEQVKRKRETHEKQMEEWKDEQLRERDKERQQHKQEMEVLWSKLQSLEEERVRSALTHSDLTHRAEEQPDERGDPQADTHPEIEAWRRQRAARSIQRAWRKHRDKDVVLLQSALRAHLHRQSQLKVSLKPQCGAAATQCSSVLDETSVLLIQSAFRGHLERSGMSLHSSRLGSENRGSSSGTHMSSYSSGGSEHSSVDRHFSEIPLQNDHGLSSRAKSRETADSDDSDDIIVTPSRAVRRREVLMA